MSLIMASSKIGLFSSRIYEEECSESESDWLSVQALDVNIAFASL